MMRRWAASVMYAIQYAFEGIDRRGLLQGDEPVENDLGASRQELIEVPVLPKPRCRTFGLEDLHEFLLLRRRKDQSGWQLRRGWVGAPTAGLSGI
jgi:hypothetical protein